MLAAPGSISSNAKKKHRTLEQEANEDAPTALQQPLTFTLICNHGLGSCSSLQENIHAAVSNAFMTICTINLFAQNEPK